MPPSLSVLTLAFPLLSGPDFGMPFFPFLSMALSLLGSLFPGEPVLCLLLSLGDGAKEKVGTLSPDSHLV